MIHGSSLFPRHKRIFMRQAKAGKATVLRHGVNHVSGLFCKASPRYAQVDYPWHALPKKQNFPGAPSLWHAFQTFFSGSFPQGIRRMIWAVPRPIPTRASESSLHSMIGDERRTLQHAATRSRGEPKRSRWPLPHRLRITRPEIDAAAVARRLPRASLLVPRLQTFLVR